MVDERQIGRQYFRKVYEEKMENRGLRLIDVSGDADWIGSEVDFIVIKDDRIYQKIRVVLDSQCYGNEPTGEIVYEYRRKDGEPGWCETTKADYAVYVFGSYDKKRKVFDVVMTAFVDVEKWRLYTEATPEFQSGDAEFRQSLAELRKEGVVATVSGKVRGDTIKFV